MTFENKGLAEERAQSQCSALGKGGWPGFIARLWCCPAVVLSRRAEHAAAGGLRISGRLGNRVP